MQRRMGDLDDENNGEKLRLPTLTLYTGTDQRLIPSSSNNNKPPINLHLSLGGSYSNSNSTTSYLDENNMNNVDQTAATPVHQQQEIILVDDDDIDWAARSASENRALIRALHIIKSESCTNAATHHRRKTSSSHLRNQGVFFQEEEEEEGGIGKCMMNPDDFLSINFDDHDNINSFKDASSSSSSSSSSPPENNIRLLFPTTHHDDKGKSAPPIPNYYYNSNNNIVAPPPFAFASNHWSNGALMKKNEYVRDSEVEMIRLMPTVATEGGIPGGRRIEGFLYRYSRYEDVIIVCFCHGRFFTPKEFVMHSAAGVTVTEFQNPMRLITIVPND